MRVLDERIKAGQEWGIFERQQDVEMHPGVQDYDKSLQTLILMGEEEETKRLLALARRKAAHEALQKQQEEARRIKFLIEEKEQKELEAAKIKQTEIELAQIAREKREAEQQLSKLEADIELSRQNAEEAQSFGCHVQARE